ncbi:MAG TPA: hypothetical protein VF943_01110 [Burkholderiales bacterium]
METVYRAWGQYREIPSRIGDVALDFATRHMIGVVRLVMAAMSLGIFGLIGYYAGSGSIVALALVPMVAFELTRGR